VWKTFVVFGVGSVFSISAGVTSNIRSDSSTSSISGLGSCSFSFSCELRGSSSCVSLPTSIFVVVLCQNTTTTCTKTVTKELHTKSLAMRKSYT
jgi:hypothetical protein